MTLGGRLCESSDTTSGLDRGGQHLSRLILQPTESQRMAPIVLVLDSDLGFTFALSQELGNRNITALPARAIPEARNMLKRFRVALGVLVINCGSPGACTFVDEVAEMRPDARIIGIVTEDNNCQSCADRLTARFDDRDRAPERIPHCADVIQSLLTERRPGTRHAG